MTHNTDLIVRSATSADREQLARLAALDSSRPVEGRALVAEADARIVAALPLGTGRPVADPFEPTAEVIALLELRASQLTGGASTRRSLRDRFHALVRAPLPS